MDSQQEIEKQTLSGGLQPGYQKSLFPSRKAEKEMLMFKEIFVDHKEKELEKLKEKAKLQMEEFESKKLAPVKLKRKKGNFKPDDILNSSSHALKQASIENYLKAQKDFSTDEEDEEEKETKFR